MRVGTTAFVTGASSGFGMATASLLAAAGCRVFGTSRKPRASPGAGVEMLTLDVRSDDSVQQCIEGLLRRTDRVDLLVNNAGQIHVSIVEDTTMEQARGVMETNFWGVVRVTNAILPIMRRQRGGRIINVSSLAGLVVRRVRRSTRRASSRSRATPRP